MKIFKVPFASAGDKIAIPVVEQPSGEISQPTGWTPDYQLPNTDPNYKPVGRAEMNGILFEITEALGQLQQFGFASWIPITGGWPIGANVNHGGGVWQSLANANTTEPGTGSLWKPIKFDEIVNATTLIPGLVELATAAETAAGSDATRSITPAGLSASGLTTGRLLRISVYDRAGGVNGSQRVAVNGGTPTTSGASNFTPLPTTGRMLVEVQGGGSAGGGASATTAGVTSLGSGGGGGSYSLSVLPPQGGSVVVGAGGVGAVAPGQNGGSSSFGGSLVTAPGGQGGTDGPFVTLEMLPFAGSPSLQGAAGNGNIIARAGTQGLGCIITGNGRTSGRGGDSQFGAGGPGRHNGQQPGLPGLGPGAGGGGAEASHTDGANRPGGNGAAGIVIIYEYSS